MASETWTAEVSRSAARALTAQSALASASLFIQREMNESALRVDRRQATEGQEAARLAGAIASSIGEIGRSARALESWAETFRTHLPLINGPARDEPGRDELRRSARSVAALAESVGEAAGRNAVAVDLLAANKPDFDGIARLLGVAWRRLARLEADIVELREGLPAVEV